MQDFFVRASQTKMKKKNKEIATFKIAQELGGLELLDAKYEKQNFSRHK